MPTTNMSEAAGPLERHATVPVRVGSVLVGGGAPIVVQSMTNTDTADVDSTVAQVAALARAGSEMVRITVDRDEAAADSRRCGRQRWARTQHRRSRSRRRGTVPN